MELCGASRPLLGHLFLSSLLVFATVKDCPVDLPGVTLHHERGQAFVADKAEHLF